MEWMDRERKFWLVGGDRRQQALARLLEEDGHTVHVTALEGEGLRPEPLGPGTALAHCVLLPLPVTQGKGLLHTPLSKETLPLETLLAVLEPGQILCGGLVSPSVRRAAEKRGLRVFDYYAREECMVANAVPTAVEVGRCGRRDSSSRVEGDTHPRGYRRFWWGCQSNGSVRLRYGKAYRTLRSRVETRPEPVLCPRILRTGSDRKKSMPRLPKVRRGHVLWTVLPWLRRY